MRGILHFGALCALGGALGASAACDGGSGGGGQPDATIADATPAPDAPPDAAPDGPPTPTGSHRWVIDRQRLPATNSQAQLFGLDLNGDAVVDNQLGAVIATLMSQGIDVQAHTDTAVARGSLLMLGEAGVGPSAAATFTMYTGANPQPAPCNGPGDLVCRRHLMGTGSFDLAATSAHDPPLTGTLSNDTLVAGPGHLQVSMLFVGSTPIVLDLIGARVRLQAVAAGSLGQSVIAGAITQVQRDDRIYPGLHQSVATTVAADCLTMTLPDCGCAAGSTGRTMLNLFDTTPKNCTVTLQEIRDSPLIKSLFAPDVTVEGQAALSFGFAVTATQAAFMP